MKSLLKNQHCYKQCIRSSDQYEQDNLKDGEELEECEGENEKEDSCEKESESQKEGNDSDQDSMYMPKRIDKNVIRKEGGNENEGGHAWMGMILRSLEGMRIWEWNRWG